MEKADDAYVAELRREYMANVEEMLEANADFDDRLRQASVASTYDAEDDLFEITLDGPQEAESLALGEDLWLRLDPDTRMIVGVELENFLNHMRRQSTALRFCLHVLQVAGSPQVAMRFVIPQEAGADPLKDMRELALA